MTNPPTSYTTSWDTTTCGYHECGSRPKGHLCVAGLREAVVVRWW